MKNKKKNNARTHNVEDEKVYSAVEKKTMLEAIYCRALEWFLGAVKNKDREGVFGAERALAAAGREISVIARVDAIRAETGGAITFLEVPPDLMESYQRVVAGYVSDGSDGDGGTVEA